MRKKILIIAFILITSILFIPFFKGHNLVTIAKDKIEYFALPEDRQAVYDKMKIEYLNIKSRKTGTAPFNDGTISNEFGVDVSDSDNYVRTFDLMKYTIEVGIAPNTDHSGVTNSSVFQGGVIKVRAKLPNQGTPTMMRWEADAWMKNVSYSNDKTEIYAEYHVPSGTSITNANQRLSFTIKTDGYKRQITDAMKPEFEVWMEGNKPDDATSSADLVNEKDTRSTIISGKYSFDFNLRSGNLNNYGERDGKEGHYINYAVLAKLYQPYSYISDLRGVLYPTGKIHVSIDGEYKYYYSDSEGGWITITDQNHLLNDTSIVAFTTNGVRKDGFYPDKMYYLDTTVGGKRGSVINCVYDGGTVDASLNNNKFNVSFENYKFDGKYPTAVLSGSRQIFSSREGAFASANIEMFVPIYNPLGRTSVNNQIILKIKKVTIDGDNYTIGENEEYVDGMNNDTLTNSLIQRRGAIYSPLRTRTKNNTSIYLSTNYWTEDAASTIGDDFIIEVWTRAHDGPYYGGVSNLIAWNNKMFEIQKYTLSTVNDPESMYDISALSDLGFDIPSEENITVKYGIYKTNTTNGILTNQQVNAAQYEDFNWYPTYAQAITNGKVAAVFIEDPDNTGYGIRRYFRFKMKTVSNTDNVGKVGMFRSRTTFYADAAKTEKIYYGGQTAFNSPTGYTPTTYDDSGNILSAAAPEELGESVLIVGVKSGVSITTTDTTSSGEKKKAFDVQDGEIHLQINPSLSNGQLATNNDRYLNNVIVKAHLPNGLVYKNGSANKTPSSVTVNPDGTTTIEWTYNNWQINHNAPEYPTLTFTADISASLENNTSLNIKSTIHHSEDLRDETNFRKSEYGVIISNLAGSKGIKSIDKTVVEKNEKFNVTSTLGNNSEEVLSNVKTIEILPTNNDENGSKFSGNYTVKFNSIIQGQRLFYTTNLINNIGLTQDKYGKYTIKDVDLANDNRWIEINVGNTIPSNATAVATYTPSLPPQSESNFVMEITPTGNKEKDSYGFSLNMTSNNLEAAIRTNTVITRVVSRNIKGKAFIDKNRNGIYDSGDELLKTNVVKLINSSGTIIKTTQTDTNGQYEFLEIPKDNYIVEFSIPENYETIEKSVSSKVNSNGRTDTITDLNIVPNEPILEVNNIDMGIRKIAAKIHINYEEYNNSSNLFDSKEIDKYYGDTYNIDTDYTPNIPDNYEFKSKTNNYTGTVNQKDIYVTYYYQKKDSQLELSIEKSGTDKITTRNDKVNYTITTKTKIKDYLGNATIKIVDTLPYKIDESNSNLDGGVYNDEEKTITWTINKSIESINEPEIEITKSIELLYKDVDATKREMINNVEAKVTLDNNERSTSNSHNTLIRIPGTIKIRYIEVDEEVKEKGSIIDDIQKTGLIGDSLTTEEKEFEPYDLFEKPSTEEYTYQEDEQEVIYKYKKKKVNVKTIAEGIGGKIKGDEEVYYGDDSTFNRIIIEADEGYEIESITINGEDLSIKKNQTKMVIENFKNMKEDKTISVKFKKKEIDISNPFTGTNIIISLFIILVITNIVMFTISKKYQRKIETL